MKTTNLLTICFMLHASCFMLHAAMPAPAPKADPNKTALAAKPTVVKAEGGMKTAWGEKVTAANAWREYPRPQLVRKDWMCLNGEWEYAVTTALQDRPEKMEGKILVPFCFESILSGVMRDIAPVDRMWYRRHFELTPLANGERLLLHFEGVDYRSQVFLNGLETLEVPHEGPYPFTVDATDYVKAGDNTLEVLAWDPTGEGGFAPFGKQTFRPGGCNYHRVSGIWQSVWCERVPATYLKTYRTLPDIDRGIIAVKPVLEGDAMNAAIRIEVQDAGRTLAAAEVTTLSDYTELTMPKGFALWSPKSPKLYDLVITVRDRRLGTTDTVRGYFGMRKFEKRKDAKGIWRIFVNNEPLYLMGTLDQGFWPDGIWTPPSDEAQKADIQFLKNAGFNMTRKHMKVENLRWYYHCDTLGLLVMQDVDAQGGTWKVEARTAEPHDRLIGRHRAEIDRRMELLMFEPCLICWIPYNEGVTQPWAFQTHQVMSWVKRRDPSRLVCGPSGWNDFDGGSSRHREPAHPATHPSKVAMEKGDLIDMHCYPGPDTFPADPDRVCFLGEWGGVGLNVPGHLWAANAWGYAKTASIAEFEKRYISMVARLGELTKKGLSGSVYTQTTDCEREANGLITYDRKVPKFDLAKVRAAHEKVIAEMSK